MRTSLNIAVSTSPIRRSSGPATTRPSGRAGQKSSPATSPIFSQARPTPRPTSSSPATRSITFRAKAKIALIADCHRVLAPGGTFVWIDPVRREDESRDAYIDRLTHVMQNDWTALTPDQREKACTHVRDSDFPETGRWMLDHAARGRFRARRHAAAQRILRRLGLHKIFVTPKIRQPPGDALEKLIRCVILAAPVVRMPVFRCLIHRRTAPQHEATMRLA